MADSSLDDFFAKKDKSKKSKTKTKFTTTDTIAKKLEEGGRKPEFIKRDLKEKTAQPSTNANPCAQISNEQDDDEWKYVEDERERDYSGLRVQDLSISEKEKEEEQLKEQMAEQNGDIYKSLDGVAGPWKIQTSPAVEIEEPKSPEVEVKDDIPVSKTAAYKPPALRNASATISPSSVSTRRNPKSAPQISSELHFPSLSSAAKGKYSDADRSFQSVKHGIRSKNETQHSLQLDLENKFSALHQGD